jgi:hypothetical protein
LLAVEEIRPIEEVRQQAHSSPVVRQLATGFAIAGNDRCLEARPLAQGRTQQVAEIEEWRAAERELPIENGRHFPARARAPQQNV